MAIYHTRTTNNLKNALKLLLGNRYLSNCTERGRALEKLKDCLDDDAATIM